MRAWLRRSDFTSAMISSLSFLYLRSCAGDSEVFLRRFSMSCSCRRRSRLYSLATVSKVSSTFGLSSASIAASESEFSMSSSSISGSPPGGEPEMDEDDMENSLSLAAIEAELKPKVLETFDTVASEYKRLRRLQEQDIENRSEERR